MSVTGACVHVIGQGRMVKRPGQPLWYVIDRKFFPNKLEYDNVENKDEVVTQKGKN